MAERNSFIFYYDFAAITEEMSGEDVKTLLSAVVAYDRDGVVPDLNGEVKIAFVAIKVKVDRDRAKWEAECKKRSAAGRKGGNKKAESSNAKQSLAKLASASNAKQSKQGLANLADNDCDCDYDHEDQEIKTFPPCVPPAEEKPKKKPTEKTPMPDIDAYDFSPPLRSKVGEWLTYKAELGKKYQPMGLKSLLTQISNRAVKHGDAAVIDLIGQSMASGYQGIVFDRLDQPSRAGPKRARGAFERTGKFESVEDDDL